MSKEYAAEIAWINEHFKEYRGFGLRLSIDFYPSLGKKIIRSQNFPSFSAEILLEENSENAFYEWLRESGVMEL